MFKTEESRILPTDHFRLQKRFQSIKMIDGSNLSDIERLGPIRQLRRGLRDRGNSEKLIG
jgi:hypothetical protein